MSDDMARYLAAPDGSNEALNIRLKMLAAEVAEQERAARQARGEFAPGDRVWWQARKGRVRTPNALPARVIRKLRTRYEVQVLAFDDHRQDHPRWKPAPADPADLTPMKGPPTES